MEISRGRKALFETSEFCNHDKVVSGATSLSQLFSIFVSSPPSVQEMKFPNYVGACTSPVVRPCCTWGVNWSIGFVRKRSQIPATSSSCLVLTMFFYQVPKNEQSCTT